VSDRDRSAELKKLAHDVRNALNGVSVNLEVARSRAARGIDVAQVAPFIETAAQQLETAVRLHKRYADMAAGLAALGVSCVPDSPAADSAATSPADSPPSHS
jgi:hypothetical protein